MHATPEGATVPVAGTIAEFTASGTVITFRGFLAAYEEGHDEERNADDAPGEAKLPPLREGQSVALAELEAKGHETSPPPRYTEASLVKRLEELGIGRPSTFASIISTILDRGYVTQRGQALVPSWIAFSVVRLLEEHFGDLVEYDFTAEMEDDLDHIAAGEADRVDWLSSFYFGSDKHRGLRQVVDNLGEIDAREINSVQIAPDVTLRIGKYGPYLEAVDPDAAPDATPRRVNLPADLAPDELTEAKARELIDAPVQGDRVLGANPENGKQVVVKDGRFGPYVTEVEPEAEAELEASVDPATGEVVEAPKPKRGAKKAAAPKPRTASLFKSMQVEEIDLDTALKLLDLPRVVGLDPESGEEITAQNGRYGPYLKKAADTRTLPSEDAIFEIDLPGALELFAQPKYGARRASSALKEFDNDPVSGKPIKVKDGRFGPYVTDGTTNATIPRAESVEEITFERAVELLQIKRDKGPAAPRAKRRRRARRRRRRRPPRSRRPRRAPREPRRLHHPRGWRRLRQDHAGGAAARVARDRGTHRRAHAGARRHRGRRRGARDRAAPPRRHRAARRGAAVRGRPRAPRRHGRPAGARARRRRDPGPLHRLVGRLPGRRPGARPRGGARACRSGPPRACGPTSRSSSTSTRMPHGAGSTRRARATTGSRPRHPSSTPACAPRTSRSRRPSPTASSSSTPPRRSTTSPVSSAPAWRGCSEPRRRHGRRRKVAW